ncbi:MAG: hypothetical protein RLZZ488_868 [Pseudomonadota bacterium]|jgi:hypothetical protein
MQFVKYILRMATIIFIAASHAAEAGEIRLSIPFQSEDAMVAQHLNLGLAFQAYGDQNRAMTFLKAASLGARSPQMHLVPDLAIARIYLSEGVYRTAFPILADLYERTKILPAFGQSISAAALLLLAETTARNYDLNQLRAAADDLMQFEATAADLSAVQHEIHSTGQYYLAMLSKFNGNEKLSEPLRKALENKSDEKQKAKAVSLSPDFIAKSQNLLNEKSVNNLEDNLKSPVVATLLSAVVPGSGHVYVGRWQNGLSALFFTLGTAATSRWALLRGEKAFGGTMAGVAGLFYLGQIAGATRQTILSNQNTLKNFQNDIIARYTPKSSLKFSPDGLTFTWQH